MRVAIYGGSFDPIHLEHRKIVTACKEELGVDKVILLPTYLPPHKKKSEVNYEDRINMLRLTFEDLDYVEIDDYEFRSGAEVNYAYDMLRELKKSYSDFVYVIGGDSFLNIESWYNFEGLLQENEICVVKRGHISCDYDAKIQEYRHKYDAKISVLDYVGGDCSSTYIRVLSYLHEDIEPYVGAKVANYILENKLYQKYENFVKKIKNSVSERLFNHIVNTTLCGIRINQTCNLKISTTRVFVACMLHDVAKERTDLLYGVPFQTVNTAIFHQFYGERVAYNEYNVNDDEVLDAIRFHTTAKPNMSTLGKLVFLADKICLGREYDGVNDIREVLKCEGFDEAFVKCLNWSYDYLVEKDRLIYPLTKEAVLYYKENK